MYIAHPASGLTGAYLTRKVWDNKQLSNAEKGVLYSSSIISASLPDFDLILSILTKTEHRNYITHTPFPYIVLTILILTLILIVKSPKTKTFLKSLVFLFCMGIFIHMVTDTIAAPMMLLYPFSKQETIILSLDPLFHTENLILQYFSTPLILSIELFFILSALYILLAKLRGNHLIFKYTSLTFAILSIIALGGTIFFLLIS
jgi:hypothetical protein